MDYRVIVGGRVAPEQDRSMVLDSLAAIFNSTPEKMEGLLSGTEVPLKKAYNREDAEAICEKIRASGALCRVEEIPSASSLDDQELVIDTVEELSAEALDDDSETTDSESGISEEAGTPPSRETGLSKFIGPNSEYYLSRFQRFGSPESPKFVISWHWPAFFFFFVWALYRKLWGWALFHLCTGTLLMMVASPAGGQPIGFMVFWMVLWAAVANYIYFRRATASVTLAQQVPDLADRIYSRGGVSRIAAWIGVSLIIVSLFSTINQLTARFMEQYGEQFQDVGPGSGTQYRGDGAILQNLAGEQSELGRTSVVLSTMAVYLKVLLASGDGSVDSKSLDEFLGKVESGKFTDAWGGQIRMEEQVDKYILISAGPDQVFNNDDDILQSVSI